MLFLSLILFNKCVVSGIFSNFLIYFLFAFQIFPANQQVTIGSSVTIGCHALALPPPLVTWLKNGEVLNDDRFIMLGQILGLSCGMGMLFD